MPFRTVRKLRSCRDALSLPATVGVLVALLAACSGEQSSPEPSFVEPASPRAVQGAVTKGSTVGSTVQFFLFGFGGQPVGTPVATTVTDAAGNFTSPASLEPDLSYLVRACGGIFKDESDESGLRTITLASNQCLESVLPPGVSSVAITPYTQALVDKIRREAVSNSFASLLSSNRGIFTQAFGFDVLTTLPTDPVNPSGSPAQIASAMTLGGAAAAMNSIAIQLGLPQMNFAIVRAFARDLSDGFLNGVAAGQTLMINGQPIPDIDLNGRIRLHRNNFFNAFGGAPLARIDENLLSTPGTPEVLDQPPVAVDDTFSVPLGQVLNVAAPGILANDAEPDGQALTAALVDAPTQGQLQLQPDGSFVYTPDAASEVTDSFTYRANDGTQDSNLATVTINVTALPRISIGDAQISEGDSGVTQLVLPVSLSFAASGVSVDFTTQDGSATTANNDYSAQSGTVNLPEDGSDATITLQITGDTTVEPDETFTVVLSNPQNALLDAAIAEITIVNDDTSAAPNAVNDSATVPQDSGPVQIDVLANDSDPEGDPLTILSLGMPSAGGSVSHDSSVVTYQPVGGFAGTETFTYTIGDGFGGTDTATVTVSVQAPPPPPPTATAPVAVDDSITIPEGNGLTTINVLANDSDPNGDPITIVALGMPSQGGFVQHDGSQVQYEQLTPGISQETFTYTISDGNETATATVTVNIQQPANTAPTANNDMATVAEDSTANHIDVVANDTDPDGDPLTLISVSNPTSQGGSVTISTATNEVVYDPPVDFNGTDTFTYTIEDGQGGSDSAIVTVTVTPANDAPVANDDTATTDEDTTVLVPVLGNDTDVDGDPLAVHTVGTPSNGSAVINGSQIEYTPDPDFNGTDSFTYSAEDPAGAVSNDATVTVTVNPVNDAPTATANSYMVDEDAPAADFDVLADDQDVDGDILMIDSVTGPTTAGTITNNGTSLSYAPPPDFVGTETFTYFISDPSGASDSTTVSFNVGGVNDNPVATDDSATTDEDTTVTISVLANDTDVDGDTLSIGGVSTPVNGGTLSPAGTQIDYTPAANFNGTDSFSYTVTDGNGGSDSATVTVTITAVNDPPVAVADSLSVDEGGSATVLDSAAASVLANDTDVEGDPLTAVVVTLPVNGTMTLNSDGSFSYTHDGSETTSDSFQYKANDGSADSNTVTVSITVSPVNDPPVAVADSLTVNEGGSATVLDSSASSVLANDTDPDVPADTLSATLATPPVNGTLTLNADGTFSYTHDGSETISDSFQYKANDGAADSNTVTVGITVNPVNDPPFVATSNPITRGINSGAAPILNTDFAAGDNDNSASELTFTLTGGLACGALSSTTFTQADIDAGTVTFDPDGGTPCVGGDSLTVSFDLTDGTDTTIATLVLNISAMCTAPPANLDAWITGDTAHTPTATTTRDIQQGRTGSLIGGASNSATADGRVSEALALDGVDDEVNFGPDLGNFATADFSIDFWMQTASTTTQDILSKRPFCPDTSFFDLRINTLATPEGRLVFEAFGSGGSGVTQYSTRTNLDDGQYHHVAIVRQGSDYLMYIDGILDNTVMSDGVESISNAADFLIGSGACVAVDGTERFTGLLDELEVINRALTATEVSAIHRAGNAGKCKPAANSDADSDGLVFADELSNGTNPNNPDTDGDGISDFDEVNVDGNPGDFNPGGGDSDPNDPNDPQPTVFDLSTLDGNNGLAINGIQSSAFSPGTGDRIGLYLNDAGDVNDDGYDDILVASNFHDSHSGEAYLIYGRASGFPATLELSTLETGGGADGFVLRGPGTLQVGVGRANAGDINGDGIDDLLIGAPDADPNSVFNAGEAFVVYGRSGAAPFPQVFELLNMTVADGLRIEGIDVNSLAGDSVDAADINGDGFNDLVINGFNAFESAVTANDGKGRAYVVFGGPTLDALDNPTPGARDGLLDLGGLDGTNGFYVDGQVQGDRFAEVAMSPGDLDGDGLADLMFGSYRKLPDGSTPTGTGEVHLIFGRTGAYPSTFDQEALRSGDGSEGCVFTGGTALDFAGFRIVRLGDVDGDNIADVLIAAERADGAAGTNTGKAYLLFGNPGFCSAGEIPLDDLSLPAGMIFEGAAADDLLGAVNDGSRAGDFDADGFNEVMVGSRGFDAGATTSVGQGYLVYGNAAPFSAPADLGQIGQAGLRFPGLSAGDQTSNIATAGDVNGDGFDDALVGAILGDPGGRTNAGIVYAVFGFDVRGQVAFPGTVGTDLLTGDGGDNILVGGDGKDRLDGGAGDDVLIGARGDDEIVFDPADTRRVDGGRGFDTLDLNGNDLDLPALNGIARYMRLRSFERVLLNSTLKINKLDLLRLTDETDTLRVEGTSADAVTSDEEWNLVAGQTIDGVDYRRFEQGRAVLLVQFAVDASGLSSTLATDTDGDGLSDGDETVVYGTDPNLFDSDADGLGDGDEVNTHGTDPLAEDSDADDVGDGLEVAYGSDPGLADSAVLHVRTSGSGGSDSADGLTWGTAIASNIEVAARVPGLSSASGPVYVLYEGVTEVAAKHGLRSKALVSSVYDPLILDTDQDVTFIGSLGPGIATPPGWDAGPPTPGSELGTVFDAIGDGPAASVLPVSGGNALSMDSIELTGGSNLGGNGGGGLTVGGEFSGHRLAIFSNEACIGGGLSYIGPFLGTEPFLLEDSWVSDNTAMSSDLVASCGSTFTGRGGGIYICCSGVDGVSLNNVLVLNNFVGNKDASTEGQGGGIFIGGSGGPSTILDSSIIDNVADGGHGGGIWYGIGAGTPPDDLHLIRQSIIRGNVARQPAVSGADGGNGGGVWSNGTFSVEDSIIEANNSDRFDTSSTFDGGGGIWANWGINLRGTRVSDNSTDLGAGGGLLLGGAGDSVIEDSIFAGNAASGGPGGGAHIINTTIVSIDDSQFLGNFSAGNGAGLHAHMRDSSTTNFRVINNLFIGNGSDGADGGGVEIENAFGRLDFLNNTIAYNQLRVATGTGLGGGFSIAPIVDTHFGLNAGWFNDNATVNAPGGEEAGDNGVLDSSGSPSGSGNYVNEAGFSGNVTSSPAPADGTPPEFTLGFYLDQALSPLVDHADVAFTAADEGLEAPYTTSPDGSGDTGTVDIGFHHQVAAIGPPDDIVDNGGTSEVDPPNGSFLGCSTATVILTPKAGGVAIGPGHLISVVLSGDGAISPVTTLEPHVAGSRLLTDLGDGRYRMDYTAGSGAPSTWEFYADDNTPAGPFATVSYIGTGC